MSEGDDTDTETLFTRRCPFCGTLSNSETCPAETADGSVCGHGTVYYHVRIR